jgi:hypothetical protein
MFVLLLAPPLLDALGLAMGPEGEEVVAKTPR